MKEAEQLRAYLDKEPYAIVGGVGGCEEILRRVLDRFDELEWIVGVMRGTVKTLPEPPSDTLSD